MVYIRTALFSRPSLFLFISFVLPSANVCYGLKCNTHLNISTQLQCPNEEFPEKSDCCSNGDQAYCCIPNENIADQQLLMVVALTVIISCLALTILCVICCFCPRCLMYDTCHTKYTGGEIIEYSKEEEQALNSPMPVEGEKNFYSTQPVRIKPIADV